MYSLIAILQASIYPTIKSHNLRHNSADSVPSSNLIYIKMASILNCQSRDFKHNGNFYKGKVIVLSLKYLEILKDHVKSLVYKMFINEIDFHRLYDGILEVVFSFFLGVLHCKLAYFRRRMKDVGAYQAT